ncbi:AlpA family phage regulatory protein [Roseibacterium beibuensis]|uniref:helix-turn-helix transcriptional regulator n=1 Tax=[Roseibacterium] beibuensis TaxID=1193142 RepID=UPI00217E245F|nr:AlpA family phage regulatory protein [Roseibacterium beibuensis]MCS6625400.1 AlpA family phage regulatory protein [Roseibacterium beibuensis]
MTTHARRVERLPAVLARTGMSRSWVYQAIAAGRFPKPIKIGSCSGWYAGQIDSWIEQLVDSPQEARADGLAANSRAGESA